MNKRIITIKSYVKRNKGLQLNFYIIKCLTI